MIELRDKRILVTGGAGFLGRSVVEALRRRGAQGIVVPRRRDYDLTREEDAARLLRETRPEVVLHLAAEVGGILANQRNPGRYFFANMAMALHLIEQSRAQGVGKFVQVGTICAYPKFTPVPFREEELWNGFPEETNAPYGVAKRAALTMLQAYRAQYGMRSAYLLPVNLYGPHDNFDLESSHVIPALIRKFVEAREAGRPEVVCWGTGSATREFLFVDDCAEGVVRAAERIDEPEPINLGTGSEISIRDLSEMVARLVGYRGAVTWDATRPDGQPRRCLDVGRARARLDWCAQTGLEEGLRRTIAWYEGQRH
ncbi:MAG: GDP-L-fucose synthase [Phycisphaerales bacterium]